jgi:YVTN family beta-propeller protein
MPVGLTAAGVSEPLSPTALVASPDGQALYVAGATAGRVLECDPGTGTIRRTIPVPGSPSGLVLSRDATRLFVTCAAPESTLAIVDTRKGKVIRRLPMGHTTLAPVLSPDGRTLFVCNRFNNDVSVVDIAEGRVLRRIPVRREPVAADITPDGRFLFVANHLHAGRADTGHVAAVVSVIDIAAGRVVNELSLPNGSGLLLGVAVSPDGRHVAVTHNLARFHLPTTQLDRGWMNTAALTLVDVGRLEVLNTVLLDNVDRGAATPWAVAWSADGEQIVVTHAGTHELSVIDAPALLAKLAALPVALPKGARPDYARASNVAGDVPHDLAFLVGLRERVKLSGNGARSLAWVGHRVWVGHYFSDTLEVVDLDQQPLQGRSFALGSGAAPSAARRGEMLFNDATLCFQGWQSCASCHSHDGRVDGLNWDLLNDGIGNPKNNKSLLLTFKTPPAMSLGVRETPEQAVRAGIRHILFAVQPDDVASALDEYIKSLRPIPSPHLERGKPSGAAQRGRKLFLDKRVGCADCHPAGLFTDLNTYDVGTRGPLDVQAEFDTPTLVELWRTAPYLHDGSAGTVRDVLLLRNPNDQHGRTSHLTKEQLDDLAAYLLSL